MIKTANSNGLFYKYAYDGLGRLVTTYTCYDTDETNYYGYALGITGDTVVEQQRTWYDGAGEAVASATYENLSGGESGTGALTSTNSYATAAVTWYDGLGRVVETVNYGREDVNSGYTHYFFHATGGTDNGGSYSAGDLIDVDRDGIPDVAESTPPAPNSSDNYIVTQTEYDAAGRAYRTIDNLDRTNETLYDAAGRTVRTIQDFDGKTYGDTGSGFDQYGVPLVTSTDQDVTVDYQYDSAGRLATMIAYNAKGSGSIEEQATEYLYTSQVNASWQTAVVYPDSGDSLTQDSSGVWTINSGTDHVSTGYDQLGRTISTTDERGVMHEYRFDSAGRPSEDRVTNLGSSGIVDGSIRAIVTTYDDIGRVHTVTSYDSDTARQPTDIVNQIRYKYDGWGNLDTEWQSHDGPTPVDDDWGYPNIEYGYYYSVTDGVATSEVLSDEWDFNGRHVEYNYDEVGLIMSRIGSIGNDYSNYTGFTYFGANKIVAEKEAAAKLDYSANNFAAWDRFGRVVDQIWTDYANNVLDDYHYTYDRVGNRLTRVNELKTDHSLDETYVYDRLDRLTSWTLGTGTTPTRTWNYDSLGNDLSSGAYSIANEEMPNVGSSGYDDAGNMTTLQSGDTAVYDAWNRLVEVENGSGIVEKCEYDGTGRRIQIFSDFSGSTPGTVQDDYFVGQQLVESDKTVGGNCDGGYFYIWSQHYVDAPAMRDTLTTSWDDVIPEDRVSYLTDANYNVTGLAQQVDEDGTSQVVERYSYDPYGKVTYRNTDWSTATSSANNNTILYTGRTLDTLDTSTALYYYRARYYDAVIGRFISTDPIGYKGGINLYEYCGDDPTNKTDPNGLQFPTHNPGNCLTPGSILNPACNPPLPPNYIPPSQPPYRPPYQPPPPPPPFKPYKPGNCPLPKECQDALDEAAFYAKVAAFTCGVATGAPNPGTVGGCLVALAVAKHKADQATEICDNWKPIDPCIANDPSPMAI